MTRNMPATVFGAIVLALGIAVLAEAGNIPKGFGYDVVGPAMLPKVIGGGLVLSALVILGETMLRRDEAAADLATLDFRPVILISAALLAEAALISRLGWIPVVTVLFAAGAWGFGDRRVLLNLLIGLGVAVLVLIAFRAGLGIDLPLGLLERLSTPAN